MTGQMNNNQGLMMMNTNNLISFPLSIGLHISKIVTGLLAFNAVADIDCKDTTPIYNIQGVSHVSPFVGQEVETCGVVTAVGFNGYYLQDPVGDANHSTSDGIFVLKFGSKPDVGTKLRVRDTVTEFIPGGADTGNLSITNLTFPTILESEPGHVLPEPVLIRKNALMPPNQVIISAQETDPPINLQLAVDAQTNPFNPEQDGIDFYKSLEGMLVKINRPTAVSAIRQFSPFSAEMFVLAERGNFSAPKDARTQRNGISLQPDPDNLGDQNPERIQIQFDATLFGNTEYPEIKVGDRFKSITGVVGYSFGNFEVNALNIEDIKPRRLRIETAARSRDNELRVASYNVLNLSAVQNDDAQRSKIALQIVENLLGPDIIALQEIQDNNGDSSDCSEEDLEPCSIELDADQTLQKLVDAIVLAGGPKYSFFRSIHWSKQLTTIVTTRIRLAALL